MDQAEPEIWGRATSAEALQAAWHKVLANGGGAGGDGVSPREFGGDLFANLTQLRAELLGGTYRSGPFRKVAIPKRKPGYRVLTIPSIRDRVVHTAITNMLQPILEPLFEDGSFAYRPGRGVVHAVERIERWRKQGYNIVIEADIVSYFDNIDQEILLEKLSGVIAPLKGAAAVISLVGLILRDQARALGTPGIGLVQGSPLSPLLANLYLDALDEEIEELGVKIVRFADDFVILCKSRKRAQKALDHCVKVLEEHRLRLHEDGTRIVNFDKGFDFIGYLFVRSLSVKEERDDPAFGTAKPVKSEITDEGIITLENGGSRFDPGKRVLYVINPEHRLDVRNRSFSVSRLDGTELISIPHRRVGRVEVGPDISFGRAPVDLALTSGIELTLLDGLGQTSGYVAGDKGRRAGLQLAQARAVLDDGFRLEIARMLVDSRIRNQRTQLMRLNRKPQNPDVMAVLDKMRQTSRKLGNQHSIEQLRGVEGSASALYWPALVTLLTAGDIIAPARIFTRTRPGKDPANAVINYFTGILERDIRAGIQSVHLHSGFGFLHASKDRHDGLVYDLMEPFRAPLTEGNVIFLFNARRLTKSMFDPSPGGAMKISPKGREAIIKCYETAVARRVNRPDGNGKLSWRAMIRWQAQTLAQAVLKNDPSLFYPYLMEA